MTRKMSIFVLISIAVSVSIPSGHAQATCSFAGVQTCVNMTAVFSGVNMTEACSDLKDAKACLGLQNEGCSNEFLVSDIEKAVNGINDGILACDKALSPSLQCGWDAFSTCSGMMITDPDQSTTMQMLCSGLFRSKACFDVLKSRCSDVLMLQTIDNTTKSINDGIYMGSCETEAVGGCSKKAYDMCLTPMHLLGKEENFTIVCEGLHEGERCLNDLDAQCPDGNVKQSIAMALPEVLVQQGLSSCNGENWPCSWQKFNSCAEPMADAATETDMGKLCSTLQTGKDCMTNLDNLCSDPTIKGYISGALSQVNQGLLYSGCPEAPTSRTTQSPAWTPVPTCRVEETSNCLKALQSMPTDVDHDVHCSTLHNAKYCLEGVIRNCSDLDDARTKLSNVHSMLSYLQCQESATTPPSCTDTMIDECTSRLWKPPTYEFQCSEVSAAEDCLRHYGRMCDNEALKRRIYDNELMFLDNQRQQCYPVGDHDGDYASGASFTLPSPIVVSISAMSMTVAVFFNRR